EQVERQLLLLGRERAPRPQLLLELRERRLGLLRLGVRRFAAAARRLQLEPRLVLLRARLLEALPHARGLVPRLLVAHAHARRAPAKQHALVPAGDARLLAVLAPALRGEQLALELEQRQLLLGQRRLGEVQPGGDALALGRLVLPLVARGRLAGAQRLDRACG